MADMLTDSEFNIWHRDLQPAEIQKSDREVCETQDATCGFIDPFNITDKDHSYCVSSGARVPGENDILTAKMRDKTVNETFIKERLEKKNMKICLRLSKDLYYMHTSYSYVCWLHL